MTDRADYQCKHGIDSKNARCIQCASKSTSYGKANAKQKEQTEPIDNAIKRSIDRANKREW